MSKVYIASKVKYAPQWIVLRDRWKEHNIEIISTWIDELMLGKEGELEIETLNKIWLRNEDQVSNADYVVCFSPEKNEGLRGALIECGMAIASAIPVIVVGPYTGDVGTDWGSWQYHPSVFRVKTISDAQQLIEAQAKVGM